MGDGFEIWGRMMGSKQGRGKGKEESEVRVRLRSEGLLGWKGGYTAISEGFGARVGWR